MKATTNKPALAEIWDDDNYGLSGIPDVLQPNCLHDIDRDQAVDADGNAIFERYVMCNSILDDYDAVYEYSAEEMEAFARTW